MRIQHTLGEDSELASADERVMACASTRLGCVSAPSSAAGAISAAGVVLLPLPLPARARHVHALRRLSLQPPIFHSHAWPAAHMATHPWCFLLLMGSMDPLIMQLWMHMSVPT